MLYIAKVKAVSLTAAACLIVAGAGEVCRGPLAAGAAGGAEKDVEKIEPRKSHKYVSGKWEYSYGELKIFIGGGRNPSHWGGELTYDGQSVQPQEKQDCIRTPWGWLAYCNPGKSGHYPAWEVLDGEPAADRILPDPVAKLKEPGGQPAGDKPRPVTPEFRKQVEALATQLSHDDFGVRDTATKKLIELGKDVVPILDGLALTDPETKARVAEVKRALGAAQPVAVADPEEEVKRRLRDRQRLDEQRAPKQKLREEQLKELLRRQELQRQQQ